MPSPIRDQPFVQRKPDNKEIDVQASLRVIAKELFAQRDEEKRVRQSRRYRNAVRAVLQANNNLPMTRAQLVRGAIARLRVKAADHNKTLDELWDHITHNRQRGYLYWAASGMVLKP